MRYCLFIALCFCATLCSYAQQHVYVNAILVDSSFDQQSLKKLKEAIHILELTYNSPAFDSAVLAEHFNVGHYNLSSEAILGIIKSGMDHYENAAKDNAIDLRVGVYNKYKGGKEYGNTKMRSHVTYTHRCYVLNNNVECYASHLAHEYMHEIGFFDIKSWEGIRRVKTNSVPYKIGKIVSHLIKHSDCNFQTGTCTKP